MPPIRAPTKIHTSTIKNSTINTLILPNNSAYITESYSVKIRADNKVYIEAIISTQSHFIKKCINKNINTNN